MKLDRQYIPNKHHSHVLSAREVYNGLLYITNPIKCNPNQLREAINCMRRSLDYSQRLPRPF